jgi:hypothetical protein
MNTPQSRGVGNGQPRQRIMTAVSDSAITSSIWAAPRTPLSVQPLRKEKMMADLSEAQRDRLDEDQFAFPKERKEPLNNASHVRNAISRFNQVEGVSDAERDEAWRRIKKAAKKFDVEVSEESWRDLNV